MKQYHVICQSVRGESHIQHGTPKEDAAAVIRLDDRIVGAVSDGHGDPRCMRSQLGSQMAVDIALELLRDWDAEGAGDDAALLGPRVDALAHEIIDRWVRAVESHFRENPLTEAELQDAGNLKPVYLQGRHIPHIYGATLIALLRTRDSLFLLQKGDGHAVVIDRQGGVDDQVIPWDDRCYLNVTTSLCDPDAADTFKYRLLRGGEVEDIAAVLLGSDGVEDSFSVPDLMGAYYGLLAVECVENGEEATDEAMLSDLAEMSKYGSKDDISVVGLIDPEAIPPLKPVFERMQQRGTLALKLESSTARLGSMSAAFTRREQQLQAKQRALEEFRRESSAIIEKRDALAERGTLPDPTKNKGSKRDLESLQRQIDQRNGEEARLRKRVSALTADYDSYERKLSAARLKHAKLIDRIENPSADPFFFFQREMTLWELKDCKDQLCDLEDAFAELEQQLKSAEQELEDWQAQTRALEQRRKALAGELEEAKRVKRSGTDRQRRDLDAQIEQRAEEESRLEREVAEIEADFETYGKKLDAARRERDQLLAEIEQLK